MDIKIAGTTETMNAINDRIKQMIGNHSVSIGFDADKKYPDGTPVAKVAFWNEFGVPSRNQPPRPFFRNMIAEKSPEWPDMIADLAKKNNLDGKKTMGQIGEIIAGQVKESINNFSSPALSPKTIKQKGFDKPLIDTGIMVDSVVSKVE